MKLTEFQINDAYQDAIRFFYQTHPEWICTVEQGALIIQFNWEHYKNNGFLYLSETDRRFRYVVKIGENGSLTDYQVMTENETSIGLGGVNLSAGGFVGETSNTHFEMDLRNRDEEGKPVVTQEVSYADQVAKTVHEYFNARGYRYYSSPRMYTGIAFIVTSILCTAFFVFLQRLLDERFPWFIYAYVSLFFILGAAMVATSHKELDVPKLVLWTFFGMSFVFLALSIVFFKIELFVTFVMGFMAVIFFFVSVTGLRLMYQSRKS